MKIAHRIVCGLCIAAGVFCLANIQSDIQLGFGVVLVFMGILFLTIRYEE